MKSQKIKNKALELYVSSVPLYRIAKQLKIARATIYEWKVDSDWDKLREEAIQKVGKIQTDRLVQGQVEIAKLAAAELLSRLKEEPTEIKNQELVTIVRHGLEVVRPKSMTNNLNITKNEQNNVVIETIIPKEVKELLEKESSGT